MAPSGRIAATADNGHSYSPGAVNIQTENATPIQATISVFVLQFSAKNLKRMQFLLPIKWKTKTTVDTRTLVSSSVQIR